MADLTDEDYPGIQPLANYRGLAYGPNFQPQSQGAESLGLDGTLQKLRDPELGSPFTFRVRPPATLVNALAGRGGARTGNDAFDPNLRAVFEAALKEFKLVEQRFFEGAATEQELENARAALAGGRPQAGTNLNIIETAQRANSNFDGVLSARQQFGQRGFTPTSSTQGAGLTQSEDKVAANGERFDPQQVGSSNANQAAVSDLAQAQNVIVQLNKVLATPPLTLLVNPEQLTITYTKKQIYTDRNRFNHIFQSWGEDQPRLSVTGKSGGFLVGTPAGAGTFDKTIDGIVPSDNDEVSGYQYASKWDSIAWQNLMSLFAFYRNNGYIYDSGGRPKSEAHLFIGNIEIAYDQWVYVGNFENFSYQYTEMKQHGAIEFSFEFVVSFMFDRSQGGQVSRMPSVTPSPSDERATGRARAAAEFNALVAESGNSTITQTLPAGATGNAGTGILDPGVDPFESRNPFQGPEIAPGVFLPPGSTTRFPAGGGL